jgi:replicative DNA helicase
MTKGGVPKKTLNVVMAGTNVGKSLFLVDFAADCIKQNKNTLYITLEMAEELIAHRIDANLFNIPMDDVVMMSRSDYIRKILDIRSRTTGRLIIKEYPTASAHVGHFRALLQDLRLKQNFVPDVIIIDYLTICASERLKMGGTINSYSLYKYVAEELRGLAVEHEVPIFTAAQFNREGHGSTDPSITNVGESFAIPQTADFMFALVTSEELEKVGQLLVQPMKNRYAKRNSFAQFLIGVDTDRMKLYDLSAAQRASSVSLPPTGASSSAPATQKPPLQTFSNRRRKPLQTLRQENGDSQD